MKNWIKLPAMLLAVLVILYSQPVSLVLAESVSLKGQGTSESPFEIGTKDELAYMRDQVNAGGTIAGVAANTAYYVQKADIVLGYWRDDGDGIVEDGEIFDAPSGGSARPESWKPIGDASVQFTGTYDGGKYAVSGVYINDGSDSFLGLFGYIGLSGRISNLGVEDSFVKGSGFSSGTLAGENDGTLTSCYTSGSVIGNDYTGGVAGVNLGTITACLNLTNIITGTQSGGIAGGNGKIIENCCNTGCVSGGTDAGGVAGNNEFGSSIKNCFSTGSLSGGEAGGIVGGG